MSTGASFDVGFARDDDDLKEAQRLRYDVFIDELGGSGAMVDHDARLERDALDPHYKHLLLWDRSRAAGQQVVGVYRVMDDRTAAQIGGFYTEAEFDISRLKSSGRRLLELGRSCLHRDYRGGAGMYHMWAALAAHVKAQQIEVLFGTASFFGTDVQALAQSLSLLHHRHLTPAPLRPRARDAQFQRMDLVPPEALDRRAAVLQVPALIKAYLRLGGTVGEGAYIDHAFKTIDVCLVMDTQRMNARQTALYTRDDVQLRDGGPAAGSAERDQ